MAIIEQTIEVYMKNYGIPPRVHIPQGDTGRLLRIKPMDYTIPAGAEVKVKIERANKTTYTVPAILRDGVAEADATQIITTDGETNAMLLVKVGADEIKSFRFIAVVHKNTNGEPDTPEQGKTFEEYVEEARQASAEAITAANNAITSAESAQAAASQAASAVESAIVPLQQRISKVESVNHRQQIEIDLNTAYRKKDKASIVVTDDAISYSKDVPEGTLEWGEVKSVGGMSQVWNQLSGRIYNTVGQTSFVENDGEECIVNSNVTVVQIETETVSRIVSGHKYYVACKSKDTEWSVGSNQFIVFYSGGVFQRVFVGFVPKKDGITSAIFTANNSTDNGKIQVQFYKESSPVVNAKISSVRFVDLTIRYGTGNEPTSVDDERIRLLEMELEEHRDYDEGTIISASVFNIENRGTNLYSFEDFNQFVVNWQKKGDETTFTPKAIFFSDGLKCDYEKIYVQAFVKNGTGSNFRFRVTYENGYTEDLSNGTGQSSDYVKLSGVSSPERGRVVAIKGNWTNYGDFTIKEMMFSENPIVEYTPYSLKSKHFPSEVASQMHGINSEVYDEVELVPRVYPNMKSARLEDFSWSYTVAPSFKTGGYWRTTIIDAVVPSSNQTPAMIMSNYYFTTPSSFAVNEGEIALNTAHVLTIPSSDSVNSPTGIFHYEAVEGGTDYEAVLMKKKVGEFELSDTSWTKAQYGDDKWYQSRNILIDADKDVNLDFVCDSPQNVTRVVVYSSGDVRMYAQSTDNDLTGTIFYKLANPQILDVTEYFPDENYRFIEVEGGGTITFKQDGDYKLAIPSVLEYDVKVGD